MKETTQCGKIYPTDTRILRAWMETIPTGKYNEVKWRLVEVCLVPMTTVNNWMQGIQKISMAAKRDINSLAMEVSGKEIFEIVVPEIKKPCRRIQSHRPV